MVLQPSLEGNLARVVSILPSFMFSPPRQCVSFSRFNLIWIGIYKLCAFKSSYIRNTEKTKNTRYVNSKPHPRKASEPVHPKNQATLLNLLTYAQQTLCQLILISPVGPMSYLKA